MLNIFLANIIFLFHVLIVLFVLFAPFTKIPMILILHITFCISLFVHWGGNSNVCSLSVIEAKLRGLDYTESFTHKFIAPVYDISATEWSHICWIVAFTTMCYSIYLLATNKGLRKLKKAKSLVEFANILYVSR